MYKSEIIFNIKSSNSLPKSAGLLSLYDSDSQDINEDDVDMDEEFSSGEDLSDDSDDESEEERPSKKKATKPDKKGKSGKDSKKKPTKTKPQSGPSKRIKKPKVQIEYEMELETEKI